jgi:fatty-acyl-CoA synthase
MSTPKDRVDAIVKRFPAWQKKALGERFDDAVRSHGSRELIWTPQGPITYDQASEKVARIAAGFVKMGVAPGDRVALVMANFPENILIKLALAKVGAICVPINFRFRIHEWRHILPECRASTLILMDRFDRFDYMALLRHLCPEACEGFVKRRSEGFSNLKRVISFSPEGRTYEGTQDLQEVVEIGGKALKGPSLSPGVNASVSPDDVCDIVYTYPSYDSGRPRGALITHDMVLRSSFAAALSRAYEDGRRVLFALPLYHVYGYIEGLVSSFFVGGTVIPQAKFSSEETYQLIDAARATDLLTVPTMMIALLRHKNIRGYDLSSLMCLMCAGTAAPRDLWRRIKEVFGVKELTTGYGMTEVSSSTMHTAPDDPPERLERMVGRIKPAGPSGLAHLRGYQIEYKTVHVRTGEDLPLGQEGEWLCRGCTVTPGFYQRPDETSGSIDKAGWLRTGDVGIIHEDGYFELTGRCKHVYRMGGESVSPREVETVLLENSKVTEAYVVSVPDERFIEVGMAFIRLKDGGGITSREIADFLKARIARYKVPAYVRFMIADDFPRRRSGEVDREALMKRGIEENALERVSKKLGHYRTILSSS